MALEAPSYFTAGSEAPAWGATVIILPVTNLLVPNLNNEGVKFTVVTIHDSLKRQPPLKEKE